MLKHLRRGLLLACLCLLPLPAAAADFLYDNSFGTSPFNLLSTELNGLSSTHTAVSAGTFSQSNTGGAIQCDIAFVTGTGGFTPTGQTPQIVGWFIRKADGTNFEALVSNTAMPRAPDFYIPFLSSHAYAASDLVLAQGARVTLPAETFEVFVLNNTGVALASAANNNLTCNPFAITSR